MMQLVFREIVAKASVEAKQETDDLPRLRKQVSKHHNKYSDVEEMASSSGVNGFYRPRSALARALYEKQHNDRYLQEVDQNEPAPPSTEVYSCIANDPFRACQTSKDILKKMSQRDQLLYKWYRVNKDRLSPELVSKFVQLYPDEETKEFLSSSIEKSSWVWTQCWYLIAKAVLRHFWSVTDINGFVGESESQLTANSKQIEELKE